MLVAVLSFQTAAAVWAQPRSDFFQAIGRDDVGATRTAMLRGISANERDELGTPAVVVAAREKAWNVLRALADLRGTVLDAPDKDGSTALMYAALHGHMPTVRELVLRDAQINRVGWTPLHYAAANGHVEVVSFLLEKHAFIDAESPNRTTPLMMAARQGQPTTVELLLSEGADPTIRNDAGFTAADYAKGTGDAGLARRLARDAEEFARRHGVPPRR
jgi:uncharacterized protein